LLFRYRMLIGLIAGLGLIVVGALNLADSEVKCGAKVMRPGDICESTRKGITTERTYDQQRSENRRVGFLSTGGGVAVTLVSGTLLAGAVRKRRDKPQPGVRPSRQA
jgi:hypothetical protein